MKKFSAENVKIRTADGVILAATYFPVPEPKALVLLSSGTGIRRQFYSRFCQYLNQNGFSAVTYDYRGIGGSLNGSERDCRATMSDWLLRDVAAVHDWCREQEPASPLIAFGHSFGGHGAAYLEKIGDLHGIVSVASQTGYFADFTYPFRFFLLGLWFVAIPTLSKIFGYWPARALKFGENLPRHVAEEWARWCRSKNFTRDFETPARYERFKEYRGPILALSFSDDSFAPGQVASKFVRQFENAQIKHHHFEPADVGLKRIGHFGFFREICRPSLWPLVVEWMDRACEDKTISLEKAQIHII